MEWITRFKNEETGDNEEMEVEIGYQPKMEIAMVGHLMHFYRCLYFSTFTDESALYRNPFDLDTEYFICQLNPSSPESMDWTESISDAAADASLEKVFYPFKKVT